jgi:2-polyprenyl-6-hydroxyphenyl methylase/3-demethylubiquinone-9 3-methyltransferase
MEMTGYYDRKLAGNRLQRCYEIASPRVKQYLEAEIRHVLIRLQSVEDVLELGCGYGRVTVRLAEVAKRTVGIDSAPESIDFAHVFDSEGKCEYMVMDAVDLQFPDNSFDAVVCIQNGICAFNVDKQTLLREMLRVTRPGGKVIFSSYSDSIWPERLEWFEAQAAEGLLGEIDHERCKDGYITCKDGFRSGRVTPEDFAALCSRAGVEGDIREIDGSVVFCEIVRPA